MLERALLISDGITVEPIGGASSSRTLSAQTTWIFIGVSALLAIPTAVAPDSALGHVSYFLVELGAIAAVCYSIRRNHPRLRRPWWMIALALALFTLSDVVAVVLSGVSEVAQQAALDLIAFPAAACLIAALGTVLRIRRGHDARSALFDSLIVGASIWLVVWCFVTAPGSSDHERILGALDGLYQPVMVAVIVLGIRICFTDTFRLTSYRLFIGALGLNALGDVSWALASNGTIVVDTSRLLIIYLLGYVLAGASALHPSMRSMTEPVPVRSMRTPRARPIAVLGALVVPGLIVILSPTTGLVDRAVRGLSILGLAVAVAVRIRQATTDNDRAQERMLLHARQDPLTSLPNRSVATEELTRALHAGTQTRRMTAVLHIDLDRFKPINDSLGYAVGDEVLRAVANRLSQAIGQYGRLTRSAADEFVAVLRDLEGAHTAYKVAERVQRSLRDPVTLKTGDVFISASIGLALAEAGSDISAVDLIRDADTAMYRAKDAGRNCIAIFDQSMRDGLSRRVALESDLHRALERGELRLYHQPIFNIDSGALAGFEALLRWQHPERGLVAPLEFIPIAEESGLIISIGTWVIWEALDQMAHWIHHGLCSDSTYIAVNVSARQLRVDGLLETVVSALRRSGLRPENLCLEVTESAMIDDPATAQRVLTDISNLGVKIALDDFGTGYSSLSYLQRFPMSVIKVDRSFIASIEEDKDDRTLVKAIVGMAQTLGIELVAEGVETEAQLNTLRALGVTSVQGYLLGRPAPAGDVSLDLERRSLGSLADPVAGS
jgi:diguanylate cyclase (GGDEF)-like protein